MKNMIAKGILASTLMLGLSGIAHAEEATAPTATEKRENVIDKREANQEKRIEEGVKNGSLTAQEQKRLENEQKKIKKMEARAEADGKVTKKEMKHLQHAQNAASHDIARKKHNKRKNR